MALFRRASPSPEPAVEFDDTGGDPTAHWAVANVAGGDWRTVHERCEAIEDPELRMLVAESVGKVARFPEGWIEATPGTQFPLLARGRWLIEEAWRIRGSGRATTVGGEAWEPFHEALTHAADVLLRAADLRAEDPAPWAMLLSVGMGLEVPKQTIISWFEEACARSADFYPARVGIVAPLAMKWGGSHELMFEAARMALSAPSGSLGPTALVQAHFERWLYHSLWEKDPKAAARYWTAPAVVAEIQQAAELSVLASARRASPYLRHAMSQFAFALSTTGEKHAAHRAPAARLFDELGETGIPGRPWTLRWKAAGEHYARLRAASRQTV